MTNDRHDKKMRSHLHPDLHPPAQEVGSEAKEAVIEELKRVNEELRQARRAALNLMEDAILSKEALRRSEEKYRTKLEQEVRDRTAELNLSKDLLQATMNASMDMIQVFEAVRNEQNEIVDFRYVLINHEAERLMPENTIGSSLLQLQPGVVEEGIFDTFKKVVETGMAHQGEFHYVHEQFNGWFHQSVVKLDDGVATTTADITQRKQAELQVLRLKEEAAQRATDKYEKLFSSIDEGFEILELIYNDTGEPVDFLYVETNPAFERQTGLKNVEGKLGKEVSPGIEADWLEAFDKLVKSGEPIRIENYNAFTQRWYSSYGFRAGDDDSRQVAVLFNDITERKHREQQQAFLLQFSDKLRAESTADAVANLALEMLIEQLQLDRSYIVSYYLNENRAVLDYQTGNETVPALPDTFDLSHYPEAYKAILDQTLVIEDDLERQGLSETEKQNAEKLGMRAMVAATLRNGENKPLWSMVAINSKPRRWTPDEIKLVEEVAERTWIAIERAKAEEALRQSEERLRTLADAVPQIIWSNNEKGVANYFNQRWYKYTGLSFEQSVGLGWEAVVHPEDAPASKEKWQAALAAGETFDTEYRLRQWNSEYRWHIGRNVPLKDSNGKVTGWFGSATDIEELKKVQEALSQSEARLKITMESSTDYGIITMDTERKIEKWSSGASQIFGYTEADVKGQPADIIFTEKDRAAGAPQKEMETARDTGRAADERWHKREDGSLFYASGVLRPIKNAELTGYVKVVRDMTQQQLFTEELHRLVAEQTVELQRSNEDLRQFAHVASHDLKEPIRKIQTFNNRILDEYADALPPRVKTFSEKIGTAADRMIAMIEGVLRYSKLGNIEQARVPVNLNETIRQITIDLEVPIQQKAAEITAAELPTLNANPTLMYQLFYNLILNSLKFAKAGEPPRIRISFETVGHEEKEFAKITVSDNGIGIEPEFSEEIFKTFTRLHPAEDYEGTGLGLALCKKIVERHGGTIAAGGEPGIGATFTIRLPLEKQ